MNEATQYTFRIQNYSPETLPFERMLQYYQNLANMLGESQSMHLLDITESSHASTIKVDGSATANLQYRLYDLKNETAPTAALSARAAIGQLLAEDNTSATFEDDRGNNVIVFPNPKPDAVQPIRIRDTAAFVGELYHIAGTPQNAKVRLQTDDFGVVFCTTTKSVAKEMRDYLFENIKVAGRGQWTKNTETSRWDIGAFTITDFSPVIKESLKTAIERVRGLEIEWPDDPLAKLAELNRDSDVAQ